MNSKIGLSKLLFKSTKKYKHSKYIEECISKANSIRDKKITDFLNKTNGIVSEDKQKEIINLDITDLTSSLKSKKFSCSDVLIAYARRAGTVGKDLKLIADVDFDVGLEHAKKLDKEFPLHSNKPLYGIPVSFYEQISVKGMLTTCGYAAYYDRVNESDSAYAKILRENGAIPFLKSNIPQGFMSLEANSFIWGNATNPWNRNKSAGGSNGGEAGLIASHCSPLGIGGDLFGSIRNPCNFTGVYGYKPTSNKNSKHGGITYNGTGFLGATTIQTSWGPICKSARDIVLVSKTITGKFVDDQYTDSKPFNNELYSDSSKGKIGYIMNSNYLSTAPSIVEGMNKVIDSLKKSGYEITEFPFKQFEPFIKAGVDLMLNSEAIEWINKEKGDEELASYHQGLWNLRSGNINKKYGPRLQKFIDNHKNLNRTEYIDTIRRFNELRAELTNYWKKNNYQALISPVWSVLATNFGDSQYLLPFGDLCFLENFADMPACAIPLYLNKNINNLEKETDEVGKKITENVLDSINLPVGIQVTSMTGEDEKMLKYMIEISKIFNFENNDRKLLNKYI